MIRSLRYQVAGLMISWALWAHPRDRSRDLLCDYLDEWARERFSELGVDASDFELTKRFR